jgi:PAS domain-containing protein
MYKYIYWIIIYNIIYNNIGVIMWANLAELNILGYTADEYVGQDISKVIIIIYKYMYIYYIYIFINIIFIYS